MSVRTDLDRIRDQVIGVTDITDDRYDELMDKTTTFFEEVEERNDLLDIRGANEYEKMAGCALLLIMREAGTDEFEDEWETFIEEATEFDVNVLYSQVFPERSQEAIEQIVGQKQ